MPKKTKKLSLYLHPGQLRVFADKARFKVLVTSRRWGKSRLMLTTLINKALNYQGAYDKASPPVVLLAMPSLKQAKQIHWNALCNLLEGHPSVERIYKSECRIAFKGKKPNIILRGLNEDNGDNCRGLKIYFVGVDEMQDVKPIAWSEVIVPALIDTKNSSALLTGCVAYDTMVLDRTGFKQIKEFNDNCFIKEYQPLDGVELYGLNHEYHKVDSFFNNGTVDTKKIKTAFGFELEASLSHPLWTENGWKKTEELKIGDKVAIELGMDRWFSTDPIAGFKVKKRYECKHKIPLQYQYGMTKDFAYFLGYWYARGTFKQTQGKSRISIKTNSQAGRDFLESGKVLGVKFKKDSHNVWSCFDAELGELMTHLQISIVPANKRVLPEWLFATRKSWAISFIQGFMDTGGIIGAKYNRISKIISAVASKDLIKQLQLLLTNFGILAKIYDLPSEKGMAQLELTEEQFDAYVAHIGFTSQHKISTCEHINSIYGVTIPETNNRYYWDTIESLEDSENLTFDFTIPETNSFWTNGFISHNTPKGYGTFFHSLYQNETRFKDWASFHQTIYDNPFIPREEIERIKESLPEKVFRQECLASWENFEGQIFSSLSRDNLVRDEDLPTYFDCSYLGVDWGDVNPALVVVGKKGNSYYIYDYWENPNPNSAIEQRIHNEKAIQFVCEHNISKGFADPSQPGRILTMRKAGIPKLMGGYNRVVEGNGIINTLLFQKRLFIAESCNRVYEDMGAYHRKSKDGIVLEDVAEGQSDHLCFELGTQVLTPNGWVEIQNLKVGDAVLSSNGINRITFTGSREAETIEIKDLNSLASIRCTPDHPFYTNRGLTNAERLSSAYNVNYVSERQWKSLIEGGSSKSELRGTISELPSLRLKPVLKNAGKPLKRRVYNIEVEKAHNYFVEIGGYAILVSNCDALRYVLATLEHSNIENIIDRPEIASQKPVPAPLNSLFGGLL